MSYDPKPKHKRKGRVPPQLRAWVFGRRHKGTHDPKRKGMKYGYGTVSGKHYGKGSRGGVYWSGGHTPRYDPAKTTYRRFGRAKGFMGKVANKIENYAELIGFGVGLGVPTYLAKQKQPTKPWIPWLIDGAKSEVGHLFQSDAYFTPVSFLQYKFCSTDSHWCVPFWGSLVGRIVTGFGSFGVIPARWNKLLKKIFTGSLIGSVVGGLTVLGSDENRMSPTTSTSTNALTYYG